MSKLRTIEVIRLLNKAFKVQTVVDSLVKEMGELQTTVSVRGSK